MKLLVAEGRRFAKFALVGASGYVVNLGFFVALVHAGVHYVGAAASSFVVAATWNYWLNRTWTFRSARGPLLAQGWRFFAVASAALAANLVVLHALVRLGVGKLPAQGAAIGLATPFSFAGNRLWAFREAEPDVAPPLARLRLLWDDLRCTGRIGDYRSIVLWWALSRAIVVACAAAAQVLAWPTPSWHRSFAAHPLALLSTWDGRWYRIVAERGYLAVPRRQSDPAFFPLFPSLMSLLHRIGMSFNGAGLLLANVGFVVGLFALYELCRTWLGDADARRAAIYAALFPVGFVFSMVYPEGVVLAAMALAGVLSARGRWYGAAYAAAAAALARPEGVFVALPIVALAVRAWPRLGPGARARALAAAAAAPLGLAAYSAYQWWTLADPFAWRRAQAAWGRSFAVDGVWRAAVEIANAAQRHDSWLYRDAAFCVVYLACLAVALRAGVPGAWVVAGTLIVLLPLASGSITSDARFGLLALPVYAGLAVLGRRLWLDLSLRIAAPLLLGAGTMTVLMHFP